MDRRCLGLLAWMVGGVLVLASGCGSKETVTEEAESEVVGIVPFTPPTLEELDKTAHWIDSPVVDAMAEERKRQAAEPPLATVEAALQLKNDSPENNAKILSALGRLPAEPENDHVQWDATLNRYLDRDIKSTNPILMSTTSEFDLVQDSALRFFGFNGQLQPFALQATAVSWQTSEDRMLDKLVIRDDLTWSDGKPVTAHDIAFTWRTIMNPKVPVPALRSGADKLRWVEAYDDRTVVYFHKEAAATNVWNIHFPIIPKHVYEKAVEEDPTLNESETSVKNENEPVNGGPYQVVSRVRGQEVVLARRESWYMHNGKQVRQKPYFKTIRFRVFEDSNTALLALKAGNLDAALLTAEQWVTQTGDDAYYQRNTKASGLEWVYFYFMWNLKTPFFSDLKVRQAMSYAYNYEELLNNLLYGLYEQCNGIFHSTSWMAPKTPLPLYKQDLAKAEKLLDEAGWEDHDGDGIRDKEIDGRLVPFEFTVLCPTLPERIKMCALLKECLDQIGIVCNVRPLEPTVFQQKTQNKEFQAAIAGWGTGTDPDTSDNIWASGQQRNFVSYSNPEVDKLYVEGRREFDPEKRAAIYARIDELIYNDQPYTFLYFRNSFYGFNKSLRGYNYTPRGPFHYDPGSSSLWMAQ